MASLAFYAFALLFLVAGANHFLNPAFYWPMMPPYIPYPRLMVALSGVAEMALGALLFWAQARSLAAWGIVLMLTVFFTVHVYMLQESGGKFASLPLWLLVARIPLQFLLIWWAWVYT